LGVRAAAPGDTGAARHRWQPVAEPVSACAHRHRGTGSLDETARRLSHEELAAARLLVAEGHVVRSLDEQAGAGPMADLWVCGEPVEVKSFRSLAQGRGRTPSPRSVANKLVQSVRQAPTTVVVGHGSGLTPAVARAGMTEFASRGHWGLLRSVRILGDGFDLGWSRGALVAGSGPPQRGAGLAR
jgi:hypothetical protein